jgi:iron(III) transport system substrate-binding protein
MHLTKMAVLALLLMLPGLAACAAPQSAAATAAAKPTAATAPTGAPPVAAQTNAAKPTAATAQSTTAPAAQPTAAAAKPATGSFTPDPVDMAAAKQEATVSWYTSTPVETAQKIATAFEADSGIKVQVFRSGGEAVLQRFLQEVDAGKIGADVLTISDPAAFNSMMKRDLLVPFKPKNFDKIPAEVVDPQGRWIAQRLNVAGIIARTDTNVELPRNWTDLTDPKYHGMLVMPDPSFTSIQLAVVATLSQKYGWDFYQKLKDNDTMIVQGHQQVEDTLKTAERTLAAEGADTYDWLDAQQGVPVKTIFPTDGAFAIPAPTAVIKGSPHPNAARAFAEYMIGDKVQSLFAADGIYAAREDMPPPTGDPRLNQIKLLEVDYDLLENQGNAIKQHFNEIFQ